MLLYKGCEVAIGSKFKIDSNSVLSLLNGARLTIGENTIIGLSVFIYDYEHIFNTEFRVNSKQYITKPVIIGNGYWIEANTVILNGAKIGDNCLIDAGCVITGEIPSSVTVIQKRNSILKYD